MKLNSKIYIAGHNGIVDSALVRELRINGYNNLLFRISKEHDLRNQANVNSFLETVKPDYVILAAAKVGGIHVTEVYFAEFIYNNLMIEAILIHAAFINEVITLLFLGSSCIYPKFAEQPIKEKYLTGSLEPTNEAYAIDKITGIELCKFYKKQYVCDFISAMPTNLYGINDNFNLEASHVLPVLIRKFHEAKVNNNSQVEIWGPGMPKREFLNVDGLAKASIVKEVVGYEGKIVHNTLKPDEKPRKYLDVSLIHSTDWKHDINLKDGIIMAYNLFVKEYR